MQIASAHVQGNVWRVDDSVEQGEEFGYDAFYLIGDENLIAIELYLVALEFDIGLDAWEVEDAREVERVVYIQVNPEQGFVLHGVEGAIERLVVLVLQRARGFCPKWFHAVDDVVFLCVHHLPVFPFLLFAKGNGHGHELGILIEQVLDFLLLKELLAVVVNIEHDVAASVCLLNFFDGVGGTAVA